MNIRERNIKTFSSLEQLGLKSEGDVSIKNVIKKMPSPSQLIFSTNSGFHITELNIAQKSGLFFINKESINRTVIQYNPTLSETGDTTTYLYLAFYREQEDNFSGFSSFINYHLLNEELKTRGLFNQCKGVTGNWNTACGDYTGFFMGNNLSNAPISNKWFYVIQLVHNNIFKKQIAYDFYSNKHWERFMSNGNWGTWEEK